MGRDRTTTGVPRAACPPVLAPTGGQAARGTQPPTPDGGRGTGGQAARGTLLLTWGCGTRERTEGREGCHGRLVRPCLERESAMNPSQHRKRVKHFNQPGDVHELTFSCF